MANITQSQVENIIIIKIPISVYKLNFIFSTIKFYNSNPRREAAAAFFVTILLKHSISLFTSILIDQHEEKSIKIQLKFTEKVFFSLVFLFRSISIVVNGK